MKKILIGSAILLLLIGGIFIWNKIIYNPLESEYDYIRNDIPKPPGVEKNLIANDYKYIRESGKSCDECYRKELVLLDEKITIDHYFTVKNMYYDYSEYMSFFVGKDTYIADEEGLRYFKNDYDNDSLIFYFNKDNQRKYILNEEKSTGSSEEINWNIIEFIEKETELINPKLFN